MLKNVVAINKHRGRDPQKSAVHDEYQYINLLRDIIDEGSDEVGRNGKIRCVYGSAMHFSLENGKIPILTTKKTAWKTCLKELLWFIQGKTDNHELNEQGVHIWDDNSSKEFMTTRGLGHYDEGDLGPIYGFQWRHFNGKYETCKDDYTNKGVDQLQDVIDCLKDPERRTSRRLIVSAWNPCQLGEMALPPCHVMFQFNVIDGNKLSCSLYQRSVDTALGQPFNIASYSFLTHLIAKHCGLEPYEFIYYMGNCHIYEEHIPQMSEQIQREPYEFPTVQIVNKRESMNDYVVDDFKLENYVSHSPIKMRMVV
jgi:thymidylate synthase